MKSLGYAPLFFLATVILAVGFQTAQLKRTVADHSVPLISAGLENPVDILRDEFSVPHIFAETEADAYFALGYAHAQDRMWQMEMSKSP